jgi:UDP-3-O-[3-hydroxymyristoyl] glucosamine N-acyltransferase
MSQSVCLSLQELADYLGAKLEGDPKSTVFGLASLDCAKPGQLSFLTNRSYKRFLSTTQASAVLLGKEDAEQSPVPVLISENPRLSLAKVASLFEQAMKPKKAIGIHPTAIIGRDCRIPTTVSIGPHCVLGDQVELSDHVEIGSGSVIGNACKLGENTVLRPNVTLYDKVTIGKNCQIHSGTVIGSDGFGYAYQDGRWVRMPHLAGVTIGDSVEIGANTAIDRGFLEDTTIGNHVIIDNLVDIAHNVIVGDRTAITGCSAVAGSAVIGEDCLLGGGVSIGGHLKITNNVHITATTAINHSINTPGVYSSGIPPKPNHLWRRNAARFQYLDEMAKRLRLLENKVRSMEGSTESLEEHIMESATEEE